MTLPHPNAKSMPAEPPKGRERDPHHGGSTLQPSLLNAMLPGYGRNQADWRVRDHPERGWSEPTLHAATSTVSTLGFPCFGSTRGVEGHLLNPCSTATRVDFTTAPNLNDMKITAALVANVTQVPEMLLEPRRGRGDGARYGDPRRQPGPRVYDLPLWEGIHVGLWALLSGVSSRWPTYTTDHNNRPDPPNDGSILRLRREVTSPGVTPVPPVLVERVPGHPDDAHGPRREGLRSFPGEASLLQATPTAGRAEASQKTSQMTHLPCLLSPHFFLGLHVPRDGYTTGSRPVRLGDAGAGAGAAKPHIFPLASQGEMRWNFYFFRFLDLFRSRRNRPKKGVNLSQWSYGCSRTLFSLLKTDIGGDLPPIFRKTENWLINGLGDLSTQSGTVDPEKRKVDKTIELQALVKSGNSPNDFTKFQKSENHPNSPKHKINNNKSKVNDSELTNGLIIGQIGSLWRRPRDALVNMVLGITTYGQPGTTTVKTPPKPYGMRSSTPPRYHHDARDATDHDVNDKNTDDVHVRECPKGGWP